MNDRTARGGFEALAGFGGGLGMLMAYMPLRSTELEDGSDAVVFLLQRSADFVRRDDDDVPIDERATVHTLTRDEDAVRRSEIDDVPRATDALDRDVLAGNIRIVEP